MEEFKWLGAGLGLVFGILAEVWFALFQGQVGFVMGFPTIQRQAGLAAMAIALTIFGIWAADAFHPFLNVDSKMRENQLMEEIMKDVKAEEAPILKGDSDKKVEPTDLPALNEPAKKGEQMVPLTTKEKAKEIKDKVVERATKVKEEASKFVSNRKNLPTFAVYGFYLVFILAVQSIARSTRGVIRRWTTLHPAI
jgi:cytochrome c556